MFCRYQSRGQERQSERVGGEEFLADRFWGGGTFWCSEWVDSVRDLAFWVGTGGFKGAVARRIVCWKTLSLENNANLFHYSSLF